MLPVQLSAFRGEEAAFVGFGSKKKGRGGRHRQVQVEHVEAQTEHFEARSRPSLWWSWSHMVRLAKVKFHGESDEAKRVVTDLPKEMG